MRPLLCCLGIAALLGHSLACPSACSCSAKKNGRLLAECAYKELLEVPLGLSPNVSILTLSANRIGWLRRGAFAEVPEVQSLWLGYNQIGTVEPGAFALLAQLKNLDLSHNKIMDFPWQDLRNLSGLQILKMNNNRLAGLPQDAFHALKDLRSLWLNDNQLTTLAEGTFDKLPSLSQLQIFNNPFNCSCKVFWLKRWTESTSVSITKGGATLCVAPGRLKGRAVTDIPEHHCVAPSVQLTYLSNLDNSVTYDGLTLTLHCSVAGSPPPEIRWKIQTSTRGVEINGPTVARDGNASLSGRTKQSQERFLVFKNGTMAIPKFSKEDEGIYTCLAVNDVGMREVSVNVALAGSENPAEDLLQDDPQASHLGGQSCYKGDEMDPSGAGEKLVIVYHVPRESKSKAAGAVPRVRLGTLLLALGIALSW
ncbi:immunoglobulin superfamily containing leucine-rich repeat protein [Cygnus atratus]|uniref:immunoglobulin superfamily containing leucine-rich repeat protein n=1 Tax=Cygnus atratus TaxID=8868 RepID=UPI0015D6221B|nr:immunoglobulin superfamily containing leucine-rich repeat protein [Cygnus atratus]XP_050568908.1 immunoglobulin superfamily containing leucine-rich repeat protein [Cygnus atratus]XP_050568909.1 immunoglobulin superfamily containing leucine-rich repeat protein [Cygnus atratus]